MILKLHLRFIFMVWTEFYVMLVIKTFCRIQVVPYLFVCERAN